MGDIHRIGNKAQDATTEGMITMLEDALRQLRSGDLPFPYRKALLIVLDDRQVEEGVHYNYDWWQNGMLMSECIALMRVVEPSLLNQMGYLVLPEDLPEL